MKTTDIIRRAGKNLGQAKGRTFLTSLAIAVGACTITLAMAAGAGGRDYIDRQLVDRGLAGDGYIEIFEPGDKADEEQPAVAEFVENQPTTENDQQPTPPVSQQAGSIDQTKINQIAQIPGIIEVRPGIQIEQPVYVNLVDQTKKFKPPYLNIRTWPGNLVTNQGSLTQIPEGQIIITQDYLRAFGYDQADQISGQQVAIVLQNSQQQRQSFTYHIMAVIEDSQAIGTFYLSYADGLKLFNYQYGDLENSTFGSVVAIVNQDLDTEAVRLKVEELGLHAQSNEQMQKAFLDAVNLVQWGLVGFGALALLASIFGIINTQYISVLERTPQIGLMRAVGASRADIGRLFRYEAAWIGFLGAIIGIAVALVSKLAEAPVKSLLNMPDDFTILIFEPLTILVIIATLVLIAITAGYFPSRKAAKLDPIEALRTE